MLWVTVFIQYLLSDHLPSVVDPSHERCLWTFHVNS